MYSFYLDEAQCKAKYFIYAILIVFYQYLTILSAKKIGNNNNNLVSRNCE